MMDVCYLKAGERSVRSGSPRFSDSHSHEQMVQKREKEFLRLREVAEIFIGIYIAFTE